jgi:uncharacterized membrane protein YbaN (DUF454 family)
LGAVGVALPVMPATPFVLLAAICFSSGNNKFSQWLKQNRIFGPYIENYRTKQGIDIKLKIASIIFVWTGLTISMITVRNTWATATLALIGTAITIHLLTIKTKKR